jgi:hypothetical protein
MSSSSTTLRDVFDLPEPGTEGSDAWKNFRERAGKEVKEIKTAALPDVAEKVAELLEIPLPDIFLSSWRKAESIKALLDESKQTPETVISTELGDHTINSEHRPHIEVRIQNKTVRKIEFTLKLSFHLKGFVLNIRDGAVRGIQTGSCEAKGKLEYQGLVIAEKKLSPINLPGKFSFGETAEAKTITEKAKAPDEVAEAKLTEAISSGRDVVGNDAGSFIPAAALSTERKATPPVIEARPETPIDLPYESSAGVKAEVEPSTAAKPVESVKPEAQPATDLPPASPVIETATAASEERDTWEVDDPEETPQPVQATNDSASLEGDDTQSILDKMSRELAGRRPLDNENPE